MNNSSSDIAINEVSTKQNESEDQIEKNKNSIGGMAGRKVGT